MNIQTKVRALTIGDPVEPGSARLRELFDRIGDDAFERERDDVAPTAAFELVREYGFGAFRVPRELGGAGATLPELLEALIALSAIDPNVAHALRSHFIFVDARLPAFSRGLERRWLQEVLTGALFGNATTELGNRNTGGLDVERFRTRLEPLGDGFLLNGEKFYTTGSLYFDWTTVVAITPDGTVATAIVPVDREGVEIADDWDGIGQRLTASGSARFTDVRVAAEEVLLREGEGHIGGHGPTLAQLHLTAVIAGILEAATRDAAALVRRRQRTFSHGSADTATADPLLQQVVGQLAANAFAARAVVLAAADSLERAAQLTLLADSGAEEALERARIDAAHAKVTADELAQRSGWLVFDAGGASATRASVNLDRHWRNARTLASHNPAIYKTRAVGDHLINGSPLPASALF